MTSEFWKNKKVLVTGGAGFIGSFVVEKLVEKGAIVSITTYSNSESTKNIAHLSSAVEVLSGDLLDPDFSDTALQGRDVVFHLASYKKNIDFHQRYPADILRINTLLTINVLESARKQSVERVLITSSGIVYGPQSALPNKEEEGFLGAVEKAHYGYAWSKRISEVFARAYTDQTGLKIAIARPYNVYGPRDNFDKESAQVIPTFIDRVMARENPFVMWGDGNQERSFLYVEDLARGLVDLSEKYSECDPVNFGTDETVQLKDLAKMIMDIEGVNLQVNFDLSKPGGLAKRNCDNSKSRETIGFVPKVSLQTGLERTLEWYKQNVAI